MSSVDDLGLPAVEEKVQRIWREVLSIPRGGEDMSFFELSGESISAVRIVSMVEEELGISIEVGDIFEMDPNMADFARTVGAKLAASQA